MNIKLKNGYEVMLVNFIDLDYEAKQSVLAMRNHPEVRKWMYTKEEISLQDHLDFIDSLYSDTVKQYFLVKWKSNDIGIIYFIEKDLQTSLVTFGLYANPFRHTAGVGRMLEETSIKYVFNVLKLNKLRLEVYNENKRVINLHKKYGFEITGAKQINDKEVVCMTLKKANLK